MTCCGVLQKNCIRKALEYGTTDPYIDECGEKNMMAGIIELDIHRMTQAPAEIAIGAGLRRACSGVYQIRISHGGHGGGNTAIAMALIANRRGGPNKQKLPFYYTLSTRRPAPYEKGQPKPGLPDIHMLTNG